MMISEESTKLMARNVARQLAMQCVSAKWRAAEDRRLSSAAPLVSIYLRATRVQQWPDKVDLSRIEELIDEVAQQIGPHVESEVRRLDQDFQESKGAS
jgi:hypothetical protein